MQKGGCVDTSQITSYPYQNTRTFSFEEQVGFGTKQTCSPLVLRIYEPVLLSPLKVPQNL